MNVEELKKLLKENRIHFYTYWGKQKLMDLAKMNDLLPPKIEEPKKEVEEELGALERLYRSTGLIFLQWQKKFLTIIIQSLHFSSLKKKGMEKTCEKRRKKW